MSSYNYNNPISINQIIDSFNLGCITKPSNYCSSFKADLELFLKDYCTSRIQVSTLNKKCLSASTNQELIQAIINKLDCSEDTGSGTGNTTSTNIDVSNINFCSRDNWDCPDCFSCDDCLIIKDAQGNPVANYSIKDLFQNYIRRINSLQKKICDLNVKLAAQQTQINSLLTRVTLIEDNCCNTTLVSSIQALNSRVNSIDTQVQSNSTDIQDIQTNCCP